MVQITFRISFDFHDAVVHNPDPQAAAAVVHAGAMRLKPADLIFHQRQTPFQPAGDLV